MSTLEIKDLHASVILDDETTKPILKGVNLTINGGETHAIMGPNGSGKSTLAYAIAGHPKYTITSGEVLLDGENVLDMEVDERARAGGEAVQQQRCSKHLAASDLVREQPAEEPERGDLDGGVEHLQGLGGDDLAGTG